MDSLRSLPVTSCWMARVKNLVREIPSRAARIRARWCKLTGARKWNALVPNDTLFFFSDAVLPIGGSLLVNPTYNICCSATSIFTKNLNSTT
jgi:hypothetical protein